MMRYPTVFLFTLAFILIASSSSPAFAQPKQVSYTVNLTYSTIQISYPSNAMPGDTVTVNVQVTPKSNVYLQSLTATVYYVDETGLHQLASQALTGTPSTANGYYMNSYSTGSFSKSFQVNVPQDAPRTSLVAVFSETAQSSYNNYYSYSYYPFYGYSSPYYYGGNYSCGSYYCNYSYYPSYYSYYPYSYGYSPYSSYGGVSDSGLAPLSYIKANTPEFAALQNQYQTVQQQLNQTQAQNQQLQNTVSQQNATINQLNQQLAAADGTIQTYQLVVVGLGILVVVLVLFSVYRGKSKSSQSTEVQNQSEPRAPKPS